MANACYYSLEKMLSSRLLSKTLKVKIRHIKLLYYWLCCMLIKLALNLRVERRLRVFENKRLYLGRYLG